MFRKIMTATVTVIAATLIGVEPIMAQVVDQTVDNLPAPGVFGLVAIGIIGAVAIARSHRSK